MKTKSETKFYCQLLLLLLFSSIASAKVIKVGSYIFPPYFEKDSNGAFSGVIPDFLDGLNKYQKDFKFEVFETSPKRRYQDFVEKKFDGIFFESPQWGWEELIQQKKVDFVGGVVLDKEIFITNISNKDTSDFFKNLTGKTIGMYLGYHYKIADFNSDERYLKKNFNAFISSSHDRNIERVYSNRLDMAIVTKSYIKKYLSEHPFYSSKIYVSDVVDQDYLLKFGIRTNVSKKGMKIKSIIEEYLKSDDYRKIVEKYGLE